MIDKYTYVIVALLPLAALILVFQVNPYHALVIRAILGAVAALVYAVLGASDVALTEALVGTMLAVTLYVIAVRSSFVMRLGILESENESSLAESIANIKKIVYQHHLRLELVKYPTAQALEQALMAQEIHATCIQPQLEPEPSKSITVDVAQTYQIAVRVRHLFEIMQSEFTSATANLTYVTVANEEKH